MIKSDIGKRGFVQIVTSPPKKIMHTFLFSGRRAEAGFLDL